jgi:hypothetical protein
MTNVALQFASSYHNAHEISHPNIKLMYEHTCTVFVEYHLTPYYHEMQQAWQGLHHSYAEAVAAPGQV